jgi:hypothetical protein
MSNREHPPFFIRIFKGKLAAPFEFDAGLCYQIFYGVRNHDLYKWSDQYGKVAAGCAHSVVEIGLLCLTAQKRIQKEFITL